MKKLAFTIICVTTLAVFSASCGQKNVDVNTASPSPAVSETVKEASTISSYFPFKENTVYEYSGVENNKYDQAMYLGYVNGNTIQRRLAQIATNTTEVMKLENGELRLVYADPYKYLYEDVTNEPSNIDLLVLKEPLEVGAKWSMMEGDTTEITNMSASVETPYGTFEAIEVVTTYPNGFTSKFYYAKDIGLIKATEINDEGENSYVLADIKENVGVGVETDFYTYNIDDYTNFPIPRTFMVKTNMDFKAAFEEELKKADGDTAKLFTEGTKINSISLDREKSLVTVDISKEFLTEMSLGSGSEGAVLQCIANTFGNFYEVKNFFLTVDGGKYESGHFVIEDGEYFIVEGQQDDDQQLTVE